MKIAFITGCLEPGRDGVGDYTRLLAEECERKGCKCCLISLHDRFLTQPYQSELTADNLKIPLLRLSANMTWNERTAYAEKLLASFHPDWISVQFVPYSYQDKGIVIGLSKWLRPLIRKRQLHIMFHELWIGQYVGAKLKERIVGRVQKFFILHFVRQLQPILVHTSNSAYVAVLKHYGVSARHLPIFGNIPVSQKSGDDWLFPKLQKLGLDIKKENRNQFWLFGFFGTLHPNWPVEPLFTYLYQAAIKHHRQVAMLSVGRLGTGEMIWENLSKTYSSQFVFLKVGEQLPAKISEFLNSMDFGIATSPDVVIGKSGTIAAMLEHGLPIIVNWIGAPATTDWEISDQIQLQNVAPLLFKIDDTLEQKISTVRRMSPQPRLANITAQFIESLSSE